MTTLTASQLFWINRQAGFSVPAAVTMTAIQLAESGGNDAALGDVGLQNNTWGPSFGFSQIRTLKAETGRGTDRDMNWLAGSDTSQAAASFHISHSGTDFSPWTTYTGGKYQEFLGQAQAAAASGGTPVTDSNGNAVPVSKDNGPFPTWGPTWLPWNWTSNVGNSVVNEGLSGARTIAVEAAFVGLGLGLVYVGIMKGLAPKIQQGVGAVSKAAAIGALL